MNISSGIEASLTSVKQALGMHILSKSMNRDQESVNALLKDLAANTRMMEKSVNPHLGKNIDLKL